MRGAPGAEGGNEYNSSVLFVLFEHIIKLNLLLQCGMSLMLSLSQSRVAFNRRSNTEYKGQNMSKLTDLGLNNAPTASPFFPEESIHRTDRVTNSDCRHDVYICRVQKKKYESM